MNAHMTGQTIDRLPAHTMESPTKSTSVGGSAIGAIGTEVAERGYVVLESVFGAAECAEIGALMAEAARAIGDPGTGEFGLVLHPLLDLAPRMAPFYANPEVIGAVRAALGADPRLAHSGGLIGGIARVFTGWHYHRSDAIDEAAWSLDPSRRGDGVRHVLANVYLDGSDDDLGPLLVVPRDAHDPLAPPSQDRRSEWPSQIALRVPPGSVVVFDQSVWHAARAARVDRPRRLFGGHYQPWCDPTPHREDQCHDLARLEPWLRALPDLERLLVGDRDGARDGGSGDEARR